MIHKGMKTYGEKPTFRPRQIPKDSAVVDGDYIYYVNDHDVVEVLSEFVDNVRSTKEWDD